MLRGTGLGVVNHCVVNHVKVVLEELEELIRLVDAPGGPKVAASFHKNHQLKYRYFLFLTIGVVFWLD